MNKDITREDLISQLRAGCDRFQWALSQWSMPDKEYSDLFLALEIFSTQRHGQRLIPVLFQNASDEERSEIENIKAIFQDTGHIKDDQRFKDLFEGPLTELMTHLQTKLSEINSLADEMVLHEQPLEDELADIDADFLVYFTRLFDLKDCLESGSVKSSFIKGFNKLEDEFKKSFHHFKPLAKQLAHQKDLYAASNEEWWYIAEPQEAQEDEIVISQLEGLKAFVKPCPETETLAEYVFNLLTEERKQLVKLHLSMCEECRQDVSELKAADESLPDKLESKPLPFMIEARYRWEMARRGVANFINEEILPIFFPLPVPLAAGEDNADENVKSKYEVDITLKDGKLLFLAEGNCPEELNHIFNDQKFYYKIFGIYGDDKKIISEGEDEYLPIALDQFDTDYYIGLLSLNKQSISKDNLIISGSESRDIPKDLIYLFGKIKR